MSSKSRSIPRPAAQKTATASKAPTQSGARRGTSAPAGNADAFGPRAGPSFAAELSFENVERRYGESFALKGFDLDIAPGTIVCLLGPSGCGKTTLLRITAGIEKPSNGRVLINNREVAGPNRFVPPEQRGVGLMFQDFALFPHLTILDNVAFGLKALPKAEAHQQARSVLARVGLQDYADQYPHILSGGQQQRIALARAIVPRPAVMLMDEPFSGLDVQLRQSMQEETLTLLRETRATTLIVTHHPEEAMRLGDKIAVMDRGRIVQVGDAQTLYETPAALFVARLFSEINEIHCPVDGDTIETPVGRLPANGAKGHAMATVCIRERGIKFAKDGSGLAGRILHTTFLGDIGLVEVAVEGFDAPLRARVLDLTSWQPGDEVKVSIKQNQTLVFPREQS